MWMPLPCTPGCMSEASTSYKRAQAERPARNSWIGQAISDPEPRPARAGSLGLQAADQVRDRSALPGALAAARSGQCVLADVRVRPGG
jgi:hypothetical protein